MDRKVFLKKFLFAAISIPALGLFMPKESIKAAILVNDNAYYTRQIARYNKRWIEALDQRIFEILSQKIETQYA